MPVSMQIGNCKCGKRLEYFNKKTMVAGRECIVGGTICRNRKWFNFWKHDKEQIHMTSPV